MTAAGTRALDEFFARYPDFDHDSTAPPTNEWRRLCKFKRWPFRKHARHHRERDEAQDGFRRAMTDAFNLTFGTDSEDSDAWKKLCAAACISDIPETLEERRTIMLQTHVNLCDLLESARRGRKITVFDTVDELREYSLRTSKFFPKEEAYAGGLLRFLLREITGTYHGDWKPQDNSKSKKRSSRR